VRALAAPPRLLPVDTQRFVVGMKEEGFVDSRGDCGVGVVPELVGCAVDETVGMPPQANGAHGEGTLSVHALLKTRLLSRQTEITRGLKATGSGWGC
jgi:hypothetical protein